MRNIAPFALLALALGAAACKDDDDAPSGGGETSWEFDNTVDAAAFRGRLGEMTKLLDTAKSRSGLPAPSVVDASAEACDDGASPFGALALADVGADLALTVGLDCGAALERVRSFYRHAMLATGKAAAKLSTSEPGATACGRAVTQEPIDPKRAAVGVSLRLADGSAAEKKRDETVVGGANEVEVGLHARYRAECDASALGCEKDERLEGSTEARVNLKERTVGLTSRMSQVVGGSYDAAVDTTISLKGLRDGEKLVIDERTTQVVTTAGGTPQTIVAALTFAEGARAKTLAVTGVVETTKDGVTTKQDVKTYFDASGGSCRVVQQIATSPSNPSVPTPPSNPSAPTSPTTPTTPAPEPKLTAEALVGTWTAPCAEADLAYLSGVPSSYSARFEETFAFLGDGHVQYDLVTFTDPSCFPGTERARISIVGTYGVTPPEALDLSFARVTMTFNDGATVNKLNTAKACNRTDWATATPASFAPGACFFDVSSGGTAFMRTDFLKWASLYTAGEITSGGALLSIAKPGIAGDQPGARPRAGTNTRTFKRR